MQMNDDGENSNKMVGHMFQYQIWKKSLDVSYLVYVFLVIFMAVLLHYFSFELIQQQKEVISQKEEIDALKELPETSTTLAALEVAYKEQSELSESYYEYLSVSIVLYIITIGYLIQDIHEIIYASLRKVHIKTFTLSVLLNITSTIVIFVWIIKHFGDYATDLDQYRTEERASIIISRMENDSGFNLKVVLAILLAIQFTRLVLALQVSRTFGPMVKILASMLVNVLIFLVLYAAMFFIFVGAGQLLFAELDAYKDMGEAMKTLFASSIGEFDYSTYDELKDVNPYVGYIFITVFLIMISIMLLNFLIAILSNTYELLNDVKNGLYLKNVINLRQKYNYNDTYSSIVYAGPPFNIFIAFYLPLIIYCNSKKLNKVFLVIEYVGIAVFGVLAFLTISLVL